MGRPQTLTVLPGEVFSRWTVLAERNGPWVGVRCECGTERNVQVKHLTSGRSSSCGCAREGLTRADIDAGLAAMRMGDSALSAARRLGVGPDVLRHGALRHGLEWPEPRKRHRELRLRVPDDVAGRAYLAGIIDGEGFITSSGKDGRWRVGITNTDSGLMEWLASMGGGTHLRERPKSWHKPCFQWTIQARADVVALLTAVEPYLRIKRSRALEALEATRAELDASCHV